MHAKRELRILADDLGCGGARATTMEGDITANEGDLSGSVTPATETVRVDCDPAETDPSWLARVVEKADYRPGQPVES